MFYFKVIILMVAMIPLVKTIQSEGSPEDRETNLLQEAKRSNRNGMSKRPRFAGIMKNITRIHNILIDLLSNYEKIKKMYNEDEEWKSNLSTDLIERSQFETQTSVAHYGTPMFVSSEEKKEKLKERKIKVKKAGKMGDRNVKKDQNKSRKVKPEKHKKTAVKTTTRVHSKIEPIIENTTREQVRHNNKSRKEVSTSKKNKNVDNKYYKDIAEMFIDLNDEDDYKENDEEKDEEHIGSNLYMRNENIDTKVTINLDDLESFSLE